MTKPTDTMDPDPGVSEEVDNRPNPELESTIASEYELRIPPTYRGHYRRAITGRSRKAAIRAFCLECVGWSPKEVRLCSSPGCPLFKYRLKG